MIKIHKSDIFITEKDSIEAERNLFSPEELPFYNVEIASVKAQDINSLTKKMTNTESALDADQQSSPAQQILQVIFANQSFKIVPTKRNLKETIKMQ